MIAELFERLLRGRSSGSRSLLALLPCLGISVACANVVTTGAVRCQPPQSNTPQSTKASAKVTGQVALTKITPLIAELDNLFVQGDIKAYLGKFTPDHEGALGMLGRHLELLLKISGKDRARNSSIVAPPMLFKNRTVVRVRHITSWPGKPDPTTKKPGQDIKHVEDTYLAVHHGADGGIVPTFQIEMQPQTHCVKDGKFKCPPCNYEIGGVEGFLCVPLRRERGLALESASFYLIGTDVVCDVHVQVPNKPITAKAVARKLAEAFAKIEPSAKIGIPSDWVPPMHKAEPPVGMDSSRLVVELPFDHKEAGGDVTIFHVVAFGGVQHVLLVRTSKASLSRHQKAVDQLFKSYMLLEVDCKDAKLATRPLRQHTGGMIEGSNYINTRFHLKLEGPDGWELEHRLGGSAFRVHWSGPNASSMWLVGHEVPAGMTAWTQKTANRWLNHPGRIRGLVADKVQVASDEAKWHEDANGSMCRTLVLVPQKTAQPGHPRRRIVHAQLHDDLLIIVDGFGGTEADEQTVRAAIRTLERN